MVIDDLLIFVTSYANSHKSEKFIMDGAWIFLFIEPSKLKNYAVYIKGTGVFTSASRASKRGSNGNDTSSKLSKILYTVKSFARVSVNAVSGKLQKYIKYYGPLYEEQISSK